MSEAFTEHARPQDVIGLLGRHMQMDGFRLVMDLEKSQGSWMVDARDGRKLLDFYSFYASAPLGHNHPRLLEPGFLDHLGRIAVNKPANSDVYTTAYAEWVEAFCRHTLPPALKHLFWIEGGALAVENALKAAFDWKVRRNLARGRSEKGSKVIHFKDAFHGRSGYTLSLTNTNDPRKYQYFPKFDWPRVLNPGIRFPLEGGNLAQVEAAEAESLRQIREAVERDPDEIACLIIEPIQGEGGDHHFRGEFLRSLKDLALEYGFLLIFDEVQTGFGGTGRWWAFEHFGVEPDIIAFGKKTQVCGIAAGPRLEEVDNVFTVPSRISSTWGGNLVDMVRAQRMVEVIVEEGLLDHCSRQGVRLLQGLQEIHRDFPGITSNPRGRGLFCALDLASPELRDRAIEEARDLGLLVVPTGRAGIRFRPALNLPTEELELGLEMMREAVRKTLP